MEKEFVIYYEDPTIPNPAVRDLPCPMYLLNPYPTESPQKVWFGQDGVHVFDTEQAADEAIAQLSPHRTYPLKKVAADELPWLW